MISSCFVLSRIVALALAAIFIAGLNLWSPALGLIREDAIFSLAFVFFALCWTSIGVDRLRLHREEKRRITPATGIVGIGYAWIAVHGAISLYVLLAMRSSYRKRRV